MILNDRRVVFLGVLLVIAGGLAWLARSPRRSIQQVTSPDKRFVATVNSTFTTSGGYHYEIDVKRALDDFLMRHLKVHDKVVGWDRDPSITWSDDNKTVTIGLEDGDRDGPPRPALKRISIDVD
ncbi:MAG: hypothetical protein U0795_21720 [Pirellulales bacterium]